MEEIDEKEDREIIRFFNASEKGVEWIISKNSLSFGGQVETIQVSDMKTTWLLDIVSQGISLVFI